MSNIRLIRKKIHVEIGMKTKHLFFVIVFLMLQSAPKIIFSQAEIADLAPQYQKWLSEDVVYIITATEKNVFFQLETNRERDFFIEVFWKQRDPTPGTPENEFKDEHYQRINYANRTFGRMSSKRGWQTDWVQELRSVWAFESEENMLIQR